MSARHPTCNRWGSRRTRAGSEPAFPQAAAERNRESCALYAHVVMRDPVSVLVDRGSKLLHVAFCLSEASTAFDVGLHIADSDELDIFGFDTQRLGQDKVVPDAGAASRGVA